MERTVLLMPYEAVNWSLHLTSTACFQCHLGKTASSLSPRILSSKINILIGHFRLETGNTLTMLRYQIGGFCFVLFVFIHPAILYDTIWVAYSSIQFWQYLELALQVKDSVNRTTLYFRQQLVPKLHTTSVL